MIREGVSAEAVALHQQLIRQTRKSPNCNLGGRELQKSANHICHVHIVIVIDSKAVRVKVSQEALLPSTATITRRSTFLEHKDAQ